MAYHLEVLRVPYLPKGPGIVLLVNEEGDPEEEAGGENSTVVAGWRCITGGDELDAKKYGGITPPLVWLMEKPIRRRKRPVGRGKMDYSIILPVFPSGVDGVLQQKEYRRRTFFGPDYFMIHPAGRSTGCIAIDARQWKQAKRAINRALKANLEEGKEGLLIFVEDETDLPYEELLDELEGLPETDFDPPMV